MTEHDKPYVRYLCSELTLNPLSLAYTGKCAELESGFRQHYASISVRQMRRVLLLAVVLYSSFALLDLLIITNYRAVFLLLRLGVISVLALLALAAPRMISHLSLCVGVAIVTAAAGVLSMLFLATPAERSLYYVGLILVVIFDYTLMRLRFLPASALGWGIVVAFLMVMSFDGMTLPVILANTFFLVAANISGMIACYVMEWTTRSEYFSATMLNRQQMEVSEANARLEERVRADTCQLRETNRELNAENAERRRTEVALGEKERMLATLMDNLPGMVYRCLNDERWTMLFVSNGSLSLTGYRPDQLLADGEVPFNELIHPDDQERIWNVVQEALARREIYELDYRLRAAGQSQRWVWERGRGVFDDETLLFMEGFIMDVTELREKEQQLSRGLKMEAIGTLAGGIAHDFNNVLAIMIGYAELLKLDLAPGGREAHNLEEVLTAGRRARDLIQQILTFSRQAEGEWQTICMYQLVKEALKLLRGSIPATIEIVAKCDEEAGWVVADATKLHQIIVNLCTNAYQAIGEQPGTITVSLEALEMDRVLSASRGLLREGAYVELAVEDTGGGMNEETMQRIFDPFYSTRDKGRGTGLGLSIVHGIVASLDGAIQVTSQPGEGTRFSVYLPLSDREGQQTPEECEIPPARQGESILMVDDEPAILESTCPMLERLGYAVQSCRSGGEALAVLRDRPRGFDLLLTDQIMPEMTGTELVVAALELNPGLKVIAMSGYSEILSEDSVASYGISRFVPKPFTLSGIARSIRGVLDDGG